MLNSGIRLVFFLVLCSLATDSIAQERGIDLGARTTVLLGDGTPANDIPGYGLIGRYWLDNGWFITGTLDAYEYDFERPAALVGIMQDPNVDVIDATGESTVLGAMIGKKFGETDSSFDWFWSAGVAVGFPDIGDVSGPTDSGGMFDMTFDVGTEYHLTTALGGEYQFNPQWYATLAARLEQHFIDILVTDRISGNTRVQDNQLTHGAYLSLSYQF